MSSRTPTKVYGPKSFNSLCRFCSRPFTQNSSSIPIFSVTQRQECRGVQFSNLLAEYGIYIEQDSSLSRRSCPKCARLIFTSCKTLSEVKQEAQCGPNKLPSNPSVKRLAKSSPSAGPSVSVDGSPRTQGRARKKLSLGKENLPANENIPDINRVDRLQEEIQGLMNVLVEETQTITKVKCVITTRARALFLSCCLHLV